jgi:phosphatidylcholine synthase
MNKVLAWSVHVFTSTGLLAGFMAMLAIGSAQWREAMLWLLLSMVIDGVDGTFARRFKVKEVLPYMNGTTIDYVIDFATYAIIPAYFFYEAQLAPPALLLPCTFVILLVSALYYGKEGMVSNDMFFVGFPVMWNMVVFYLFFVLHFPLWANALLVIIFAIMHFVPIKFVYPSRALRLKSLTLAVSLLFLVSNGFILYLYPERSLLWEGVSLSTVLYYACMAVYDTWLVD